MTRGFPFLLAFVLSAGMAALAFETDGFHVVTSAGARQLSIERAPQTLPDARLVDQNGTPFTLDDYKGRRVLVDFIYTRCPTICTALGDDFARLRQLMGGTQPIDLLSISFDPSDDRAALRLYGDRFGAEPPRWRIAAPADERTRTELLRSFGVVVIPDGLGGFTHNDAVYVVDTQGRLARILDPDAPDRLLAAATQSTVP
jgi:protein SCO1